MHKKLISLKQYNAIHQWNLRNWVKTGICETCGVKRKTTWANLSGGYFRMRFDWKELCYSCHKLRDFAKYGKPNNLGRSKGSKKLNANVDKHRNKTIDKNK